MDAHGPVVDVVGLAVVGGVAGAQGDLGGGVVSHADGDANEGKGEQLHRLIFGAGIAVCHESG